MMRILTPFWLSEQPRAAETVQEKPVQSYNYWGTINTCILTLITWAMVPRVRCMHYGML